MKKVNIILCTYNGGRFLKEQLESLLAQTYGNIDIYIKDDGSTDNTIDIISKTIEKNKTDKKIFLLSGKRNLKYPECFISSLIQSKAAGYYAFCDQDDIWNCNKIERAVNKLNRYAKKDIPLLYYSAVDYYNENMDFIRHSRFASSLSVKPEKLRLQQFLFGGEPLGMTFVFNHKVREALEKTHANGYRDFKDGFIKIYTASTGKIIYDPVPSAKYRRHAGATTNSTNPDSKIIRYIAMFKELFLNKDALNPVSDIIDVLFELFEIEILKENIGILQLFHKPDTVQKRFKKVTCHGRYRNILLDEIAYRFLFLIGRI